MTKTKIHDWHQVPQIDIFHLANTQVLQRISQQLLFSEPCQVLS